jgi:3-phenylpropionate/trans-cinnamate dioxygenase ferredoxin subunit
MPDPQYHREMRSGDDNMNEFIRIATVTDLDSGTMKKIHAGGLDLLLARVGDRFYCTDADCPHLGGDLSEGILDGTILTCPVHHSQFDISDGHVLRWTDLAGRVLVAAMNQRPPRPLVTYPVLIMGDTIYVEKKTGTNNQKV